MNTLRFLIEICCIVSIVFIVNAIVVSHQKEKILNEVGRKMFQYEVKINRKIKRFESIINLEVVKTLTVTAYSPRRRETDSTPFVNACMNRVRHGQVAVSRDLFLSNWVCGRKVYIQGYGVFVINDLMNRRYKNRIDIFYMRTSRAYKFGKKKLSVALLNEYAPKKKNGKRGT